MEEKCLFCQLAQGELPSHTIYEDGICRVILDAFPGTRGHALILPKAHSRDLMELPEEVAAHCMQVAKKLAGPMMEKLGASGLNLVQNNGAAAGQTIFHFHLHLLPQYGQEGEMGLWKPRKADSIEQERLAALLAWPEEART